MANPYDPPTAPSIIRDVASVRLQTVSRIFVWIGLLGALIYVPIVIGSVVSLLANLFGRPISNPKIGTPFVLAFATVINSAVLSVCLLFIVTARQIKKRNYDVRSRALALSILLTLGFPILTIPGVMCFRWLRQYFPSKNREQSDAPKSAVGREFES